MKKQKQVEKKNQWIAVLLILAIIFFFFFNNTDKTEDYKNCVDDCISEHDWCVSDYYILSKASMTFFISEYNFVDCLYELEDCVDYCD